MGGNFCGFPETPFNHDIKEVATAKATIQSTSVWAYSSFIKG